MADITVTATSVTLVSGFTATGVAASTITAGQPLYQLAAGTIAPAQDASATLAAVIGVALSGGNAGQTVAYALPGSVIAIGATVVLGTAYYATDNAGGLGTFAELGTGDHVNLVGWATTTGRLKLLCEYIGTKA